MIKDYKIKYVEKYLNETKFDFLQIHIIFKKI